jgi:hypothetical protein
MPEVTIHHHALAPNLLWETTEAQACERILSGDCAEPILGQFAMLHESADGVHLIRDRLGLNKLFYHVDATTGTVTAGHYLSEVAEATGDYNGVYSVPAGHQVIIDRRTFEHRLVNYWDLSRVRAERDFDLTRFQKTIHEKLTRFFRALAGACPERRFFICLSGGLDSTVVAAYAARHLPNATAVSFSYEQLSDDFRAAEKIAARLGIAFLPVVAERRFEQERLDEVLRHGQDWRDFNVHCAWVNHHIASHLRETINPEEAIILTGDLMNEFVADYTPVEFGGMVYYRQPRVPRDNLRRFLVYGLDSSDRETGIFHQRGFTVVQPYSVVAEDYLTVPGALLRFERCKEQLNQALLGDADVLDCLVKGKVRAQVGASDGGTLGLFHQAGITQESLEKRWRALFIPTARESRLEPMIIGGRYRN